MVDILLREGRDCTDNLNKLIKELQAIGDEHDTLNDDCAKVIGFFEGLCNQNADGGNANVIGDVVTAAKAAISNVLNVHINSHNIKIPSGEGSNGAVEQHIQNTNNMRGIYINSNNVEVTEPQLRCEIQNDGSFGTNQRYAQIFTLIDNLRNSFGLTGQRE